MGPDTKTGRKENSSGGIIVVLTVTGDPVTTGGLHGCIIARSTGTGGPIIAGGAGETGDVAGGASCIVA